MPGFYFGYPFLTHSHISLGTMNEVSWAFGGFLLSGGVCGWEVQ